MDGKIEKKYKINGLFPARFAINRRKKLLLAAYVANIDELKRILNTKSIDVNFNDTNTNERPQQSPLHAAAKNGHLDAVVQLLKYGANPNAVDFDGNTPLHSALLSMNDCITDIKPVIVTLVNHGANAHAINKLGQSPMDCAKRSLFIIEQLSDCYPEKLVMLNSVSKIMNLLVQVYIDQETGHDINVITQNFQQLCSTRPGNETKGNGTLSAGIDEMSISNNDLPKV